MRFSLALAAAALTAASALAEAPDGVAPSAVPKSAPVVSSPAGSSSGGPSSCCEVSAPCFCDCDCNKTPTRVWFTSEYLLWWTKSASLPPLATASPVGTAQAVTGILGQPSTTVIIGGSNVEDGLRSGARFGAGVWLDCDATIGIEGDFFFLQPGGIGSTAGSTGDPNISRPFFNAVTNTPDAELVSFPGVLSGAVSVLGSTSLCGAGLDTRVDLCCGCNYRIDALLGYRYLRLNDHLDITENLQAGPLSAAPAGTQFDILDRFDSSNDFHGGEIGLKGEWNRGGFSAEFLAKAALGGTIEQVKINGGTMITVPGAAPTTGPGGLLALPTNIGTHNYSTIAWVPEVGLNLGYRFNPMVRVFAGYTFLYWSDVARAGSQIDLAVNPTQLPPGTLVGPARPAFVFHQSDYWAQGFDFGLELSY